MTSTELKDLEGRLWQSADMLRAGAHLAANKYSQPILGLIFLRYADVLFKQHKEEIDAAYNEYKGTRMERSYKDIAIEKCGFFLPECAYFDYLNDAPDDAQKALLVKAAMEAIEQENPRMDGVLPKEVYGQLVPEEEPELLSRIVRVFKDIPENIRFTNTSLATSPLLKVREEEPSIPQPVSYSIWLRSYSLPLAIRSFLILPVVRAVCSYRRHAICTATMPLTNR